MLLSLKSPVIPLLWDTVIVTIVRIGQLHKLTRLASDLDLVAVYPNLVPELRHEPTMHLYYKDKTISIKDGLPKFSDFPTEFGGSGEMLSE